MSFAVYNSTCSNRLHTSAQDALGRWTSPGIQASPIALREGLRKVHDPLFIVRENEDLVPRLGGEATLGQEGDLPLMGYAPAQRLEHLGDPSFCADYGIRYAYVAGAMANGIASVKLVEAISRAGMLAFFGSAGLSLENVAAAVDRLSTSLKAIPFGFNLIHSPNEPDLEAAVVDLYLKRGIRSIEASAYLGLTLPVVRYRLHGIYRDTDGSVVAPNRVMAKVSRIEIASKFFAPAPEKLVRALLESGDLTEEQAEMAAEIPVAQDITAEADSGGHTDRRPALPLFPTLVALRDRMQSEHGYTHPLRVGLGGGIGTPEAAAAAFAMGAAYIVTGSINQSCVESGSSDIVRDMLAEARQADVAMAPAADMFEMGVTVQVLKRGTMFSMRAQKLYELYRSCDSLDAIPADERDKLEKQFFRATLAEAWASTRQFFETRDPRQIERAERDPKHKMALVFRSYLGQASRWANAGVPDRKVDYQIWCGAAMGAFNEWVKGSHLEPPSGRRVADVALNILYGAAVLKRAQALRGQGLRLPPEAVAIHPQPQADIETLLAKEQ